MYSVNLKPVVNISQVIAKKMIEAGKPGAIVNVSSQASLVGMPLHTSYGASKAAMDQITRVMAAELGPHQIRINAVNPTVTLTPMGAEFWGNAPEKAAKMKARIPLGKFAGNSDILQTSSFIHFCSSFSDPDDVADGIIFLLSDNARLINGIVMPIDGGFTAC